jgi:hypothetical protein
VHVVLALDAREDEAQPGRLIAPGEGEGEGADQWVI